MIRNLLKQIIHRWPWPLTLNEKYDRQTKAVLARVCQLQSNCIDVGCFKGEILEEMIQAAPKGQHYAFEPIPAQYAWLQEKFSSRAKIFPYALSDKRGAATFHFVKSNPTYSGLRQRAYKGVEEIEEIQVEMRRLDDLIPAETKIDLIKIDVEGGEMGVLLGSENLLRAQHPCLVFEHGIGAADKYNVTPRQLYQWLATTLGYRIMLMEHFLKGTHQTGFSADEFETQFEQKINCYFFAVHPSHRVLTTGK